MQQVQSISSLRCQDDYKCEISIYDFVKAAVKFYVKLSPQ